MKSSPSSEKLERKPVCSNKDPPQPKSKINLKNKKEWMLREVDIGALLGRPG